MADHDTLLHPSSSPSSSSSSSSYSESTDTHPPDVTAESLLNKSPDVADQTLPSTTSPGSESVRGRVLIILSALLFSGMHASVRYATELQSQPALFLAACRGLVQITLITIAILSTIVRRSYAQLDRAAIVFLFARGALGSVAMVSKYCTLSRLPVGVAVALFSTTPALAALLGWLLLRERLTARGIVSMAICLIGALLIGVGGQRGRAQQAGVALALIAAACTALVYVSIRALGPRVHFFLSVQALGIGAVVTPLAIVLVQHGASGAVRFFADAAIRTARSRELMTVVGCVAAFSFAAAMCLNRGLQLVGAANAATIRTLDIPVNFVGAFLLMGEAPHAATQIAGCALITLGVYVNVAERAGR